MVQLEQDGVYFLLSPVKNPKPDKRRKGWQYQAVINAGFYKAVRFAKDSAGEQPDHLGLTPCHDDGNTYDLGIMHRYGWPEQYALILAGLVPAVKQVCGERQIYYRPQGPGVVPVQEVQPFSVVEDKAPASDLSLLGALHRLLDFCINGERYKTQNPYTLDVVKAGLSAYKRATDQEHSLRQMHKLTLPVLARSMQTLIEDGILAGLTPGDVTDELRKLVGCDWTQQGVPYAVLVPAVAADIWASCDGTAPTPEEIDQYLDGLGADIRAAVAAPKHVGDVCPACRGAVLEDESETLKAGCPACGRAFELATDDPHLRQLVEQDEEAEARQLANEVQPMPWPGN